MKNEDHIKKDFQIATQKMLVIHGAYLRTIMQSQIFIMKTICKHEGDHFSKQTSKAIRDNIKISERFLEREIPLLTEVFPPLKD